ncbi:hypothetical protein AUR64_11645 [Haloprofundus marisrubri]|uniref:Uncharacterized protein n=1 Tax=Haloprofundus marisrubri TaxID=1514971 RepID=A0A0W1RAY2_9EURY|nr:hypothetical protein AUR64_11645 [Haloprofundus marisrubri]
MVAAHATGVNTVAVGGTSGHESVRERRQPMQNTRVSVITVSQTTAESGSTHPETTLEERSAGSGYDEPVRSGVSTK